MIESAWGEYCDVCGRYESDELVRLYEERKELNALICPTCIAELAERYAWGQLVTKMIERIK